MMTWNRSSLKPERAQLELMTLTHLALNFR